MFTFTSRRFRVATGLGAAALLGLSACGTSAVDDMRATSAETVTQTHSDHGRTSDGGIRDIETTGVVDQSSTASGPATTSKVPAHVRFEPVGVPGRDPFTPSVSAFSFADGRAASEPGLYGGSLDDAVCDVETMIAFLREHADKAAAWAEASDIAVEEVTTYLRSLDAVVLPVDTRVTNHGFRDGRAVPSQAVLAAGTAVLIDGDGVPRARCACGNPLAEPVNTPADPSAADTHPSPSDDAGPDAGPGTGHGDDGVPGDVTTPPAPAAPAPREQFCAAWTEVAPNVVGGPGATTDGDIVAYLTTLTAALERLVAAAEATPGFPATGLDDLRAYHAAVAAATVGAPSGGDTALRDRVEELISGQCEDAPADDATPGDDVDESGGGNGNCGSMQFAVLISAAEGMGLDHSAVSQPYLEAIQAVLDGVDPGAEFDVADLAPMLAVEEIGCAGADAMRELFTDAGLGHVIAGTDLDA